MRPLYRIPTPAGLQQGTQARFGSTAPCAPRLGWLGAALRVPSGSVRCQKHAPLHASAGSISSAIITHPWMIHTGPYKPTLYFAPPAPVRRHWRTPHSDTQCVAVVAVALYRHDLAQIDRHGGAAVVLHCTAPRPSLDASRALDKQVDLRPGTEARAANQRSAASPVSQQPAHAATVRSQLAPATAVQSVSRLRRENFLL